MLLLETVLLFHFWNLWVCMLIQGCTIIQELRVICSFSNLFLENCFVAYDVTLFNKFTENGKKINSDGWQTLLCLWRSFDASWPVCWSRVLTRLTLFGPWSTPATAIGITIGSQQVYFLLTDDYSYMEQMFIFL